MSRKAPVVDDDKLGAPSQSATGFEPRLHRRARARQRDLVTVGVLTPTLLLGIVLGVLVLSQTFYPDPHVEPTAVPTVRPAAKLEAPPTPVPTAQPIDVARLNAGIVDKAPAFAWPVVEDLKAQPDPGRPNEHAEYVPALADVGSRRLLASLSANLVAHTTAAFAQGAVEELAKPYPVRAAKQKVLDLPASTGYTPDEGIFAVVVPYGTYRLQIEAVPTNPPIRDGQRSEFESQALHLADHIVRRLQEITSGGMRTGPEATAVHWRDHLARMVPLGR